jgi:hypothetical protein
VEPSVPRNVEAAVMHALARDPSFRPASAAELGQELAGTGDGRVTLPLPRRHDVSVPRSRRVRWLVLAIVLAAIAVAVGYAVFATSRNDTSPPPRPARVTPPPAAATAEQQARNLARWLRAHSR